jgi:uncharacterized membrane protein YraQ (UPF0718 family)
MGFLLDMLQASWHLLSDASIYVLFGILVGGLLKVFLSPATVARHLGEGRFSSVIKAALLGIPMPLCSCGVLPAAAALKRQGANNGATASFLIATPESGVDSIAITYALLDPVMTVARPAAAFLAATTAGVAENLMAPPEATLAAKPDLSCTVDACCDGEDCTTEEHRRHHSLAEMLRAGLGYAFGELWGDLAVWFAVGILLAGAITVAVPTEVMGRFLGGGVISMLLMLAVGIPLYICATASTPIAAALILKGVSPGAALVFLLAGPATNITSLTVLVGVLGKRATAIYLASIALVAVAAGLLVDQVYAALGLAPAAIVGGAAEIVPAWAQIAGASLLIVLSIRPVWRSLKGRWRQLAGCFQTPEEPSVPAEYGPKAQVEESCGCSGSTCDGDVAKC